MANTTFDNFSSDRSTERIVAVHRDFGYSINELRADSRGHFLKALGIFKSVSETLAEKKMSLSTSTDLILEELLLCHNTMGEIISLVQFEDILSQKLEHISAINQMAINHLISNEKTADTWLISSLFQLHHAQLKYLKIEEKEILIEFGSKLRDVDHLLIRMLLKLEGQGKEKAELLIGTIQKIDLSIKLILGFIESRIDTFSEKADACLDILRALETNELCSQIRRPLSFDLQEIIKVYTIESERQVFYSVFGGKDQTDVFETSADTKGSVDLF